MKVMGRIYFSGLLNNGKRDLSIVGEGVEPDKETRLGSYIMISQGRHLKGSDREGILVGQGVATTLGLKPERHGGAGDVRRRRRWATSTSK